MTQCYFHEGGAFFPPFLETMLEDEDADREDEEDGGDVKCTIDEGAWFRDETVHV